MSFCWPKTWRLCCPQGYLVTLPAFREKDGSSVSGSETNWRPGASVVCLESQSIDEFVHESYWTLTSAELRLLWDPDVLTIQWTYEESRPSTFMSTRCCWRAGITKISSVFISYKYAHCLCGQGAEIKVHRHKKHVYTIHPHMNWHT